MDYFYFALYFPSNSILTVMDYFYFLGYFPNNNQNTVAWKIN
jgi:hypothetical protein